MISVLIVDDEPQIVSLVRATLEDERVWVAEAADGYGALQLAELLRPDVVLLDVHMPGLDGVEVCRRLKTDPRFQQTRVIMLTAAVQAEDERRGMAAGADVYLTKPFSPLRLLTLIQSLLPGCVAWTPR
jgi:CheY-like chemotaxis protein